MLQHKEILDNSNVKRKLQMCVLYNFDENVTTEGKYECFPMEDFGIPTKIVL